MWVRPTLWTVKCLGDELLAAGDYRVGRNEGNESCLVCSPASLSPSGRKGERRRGLDDWKSVYAGCHAYAAFTPSDNWQWIPPECLEELKGSGRRLTEFLDEFLFCFSIRGARKNFNPLKRLSR